MSAKKSFSSSTSSGTIAAVSNSDLKVEFDAVPSIGTDHGSADADKWFGATQDIAKQAADFASRSDKAAYQALAMVLIDTEVHKPDFYGAKLKQKNVSAPQNKDALTLGIAFHYGIDVGHADKKIKANNSKALNRLVSAARYLKSKAINKDGKLAVSFDKSGVESLMNILKDEGGINKSMEKYLAAKKGDVKTDLIVLDEDRLAAVRIERFAAQFTPDTELVVGFGKRDGDNSVLLDRELNLTVAVKNAIATEFRCPQSNVEFLRELLHVGHCVVEARTDILVNRFDDPQDQSALRRLTHRHFVFNPEGDITVSSILTEAGVIVKVVPKVDLLGIPVVGHVEFRTQQIRTVEANLTKERVDAFRLEVEATPELKNGTTRLVLSSDVAVEDADGHCKTVDLLLQQVTSKTGNLPLALGEFEPAHTLGGVEALQAMKEIARGTKDAIKAKKPVKITAEPGKLSFSVLKAEQTVTHTGTPSKCAVEVRADDFAAVTETLATTEIVGGLSLGFHTDLLVVMFETKSASYRIHVPKQRGDGSRSDRFMRKLAPKVWPGLEANEADDSVEAVSE